MGAGVARELPSGSGRHGHASVALLAVACLFTALAGLSLWSWRSFANSQGFADVATDMLKEPAVREAVADQILNALEEQAAASPVVLAARPLLEQVVAEVVATDAFQGIFHAGVRELHSAVFQGHRAGMNVRVDGAAQLVENTIRLINPGLAEAIPDGALEVPVGVLKNMPADRLMTTAEFTGWLVIPFAAAALVCFVLAVWRSRNPRRTTEAVGLCLVGLGVAFFLVLAIGVNVLAGFGDGPRERTALRAVFWSMTHLLNLEAKTAITAGAVIAVAAAYSGTGRIRQRVDEIVHLSRVRLKQAWWRAGACVALIGAGVFANVWPTVTAEILIRLLAFAAFVVGAAGLLDLLGSYKWATIVNPRSRVRARRLALGFVGVTVCVSVTLLFGGLAFIRALRAPTPGQPAIAETGCNGHSELCGRRLDDAVFVGTHNAMAGSPEGGWFFRNQQGGLPAQLGSGVRSLLLDLHYGAKEYNLVRTGFANEAEEALGRAKLSSEQRAFVDWFLATIGPPPSVDSREVYLCHVYCELGATPAVDAFRTVDDFLRENPNEVLILVLEDHVTPEDAIDVLERAGLADRAYTWEPGTKLPTLSEMIESGDNVLVLVENERRSRDWYMSAYESILQDTPYKFETTAAFSCENARGPTDAPLVLANHWLTTDPPSPEIASTVNAREQLMRRVENCETLFSHPPNIIAVDFYNRGDVFDVVDELNGVAATTE